MIGECGGVPPKDVLTVFLRDQYRKTHTRNQAELLLIIRAIHG
jgi:hypothetical protein